MLKQTAAEGLNSAEALEKLKIFGPNTVENKRKDGLASTLRWFVSPISLMLLAASYLSYISGKIFDFYFILLLMLLNFGVSRWQEYRADNAVAQLKKGLVVQTKVIRDGEQKIINSTLIVPGDLIVLKAGDIVPADVEIVSSDDIQINEAAVTGESLPKDKKPGDPAYSGTLVISGQAQALVKATGAKTKFGISLTSVESIRKRSLLEKDIFRIARFLSLLSVAAIIIMTLVLFVERVNLLDFLTLDISLAIAGIPISLPTVMTLIIGLGVLELSKKSVIVRRLSSLENLANTDLLLTDKTGTLTKNQIGVESLISYDSFSKEDLLFYALLGETDKEYPINKAIADKASKAGIKLDNYKTIDFKPVDSNRKRSTKTVSYGDKLITIAIGAPQVVTPLLKIGSFDAAKLTEEINKAAAEGYRVVSVAIADGTKEENMKIIGIIMLSDILWEDAGAVVKFLHDNGVCVKMVTGDNRAIAYHVGKELGLSREDIYPEVLPEDKYKLVQDSKKDHIVAATGDGINDFAALEAADVGIAVKSAVDALRSSADIVLLNDGIAVIENAFLEARRIFSRLYTYSIYRISESFRLIISIAILGIWYKLFPLTPIQIILLALLNDIPIISLAFDRVKIFAKPSKINNSVRLKQSLLFGMVGLVNSLLLFFILNRLHISLEFIQTIFFLKLMVSGHMLIFVAHTSERWYKFLPSRSVITATTLTQLVATLMALFGFFMPAISSGWVVFVWLWAVFWMQIAELTKKPNKTGLVMNI